MPLDASFLAMLRAPRTTVIPLVAGFLADHVHPGDGVRERVRAGVEAALARATDADWADLTAYLGRLGQTFGAWDAHPLAQELATATVGNLLAPSSRLLGGEHLDAAIARGGRILMASNHLSYIDGSATHGVLMRSGRREAAERLTAVAGPKVYEDPMRLLGAAAMHTIKVAQSSSVASDQEPRSAREIAQAARTAIDDGAALMDRGRIVLIYPEGTRSRTGVMGPFLRATARWMTLPGVRVVPVALSGTDHCYTLGDDRLRPARVELRIGPAIDPGALQEAGASRDDVLEAVRGAIAALIG